MKIKTILAIKDAEKALGALKSEFGKTTSLRALGQFNEEFEIESVFVRFEMFRVISNHYVTAIRPEIRDGKFAIDVMTSCMIDGAGIQSKSWKTEDDLSETIFAEEDSTISEMALSCKNLAIIQHAKLIERLGIPYALAVKTARRAW